MDLKEKVISTLGLDSFQKGKYCEPNLIRFIRNRKLSNNIFLWNFSVESTRYYKYYSVNIYVEYDKILKYFCSCP